MTIRHTFAILLIGLLGAGSVAGCAGLHLYRSEKRPAPIVIDAPKEMGWTATTWEAASTPKYRKVLNQAHPKTIIGQARRSAHSLRAEMRAQRPAHRHRDGSRPPLCSVC